MKPIIVKEILIIDEENKKAASICFSNGLNIVTSDETSRGKSSVLRSIPYAFGCEANYDTVMKATEKIFVVDFEFNSNFYTIVRKSRLYAIFKNHEYVAGFNEDFKGLSGFYEKEFGFSVYLTNRNNEYEITPVAYSFIPYFIDQDISWKSNKTNPFKMSLQYVNDANDLFYYHLGILNKNYYELKNEYYKIGKELKLKNKDSDSLLGKIKTYKEYCETTSISINVDDARTNLALLKDEMNTLIVEQTNLQKHIIEKENLLSKYKAELEVTKKLISKNEKKLNNISIQCPNCGFEFIGSFRDIYNKELLNDNSSFIRCEITKINEEIEPLKIKYNNLAKLIDEKTNYYKNKITNFTDYLKAQSYNQILSDLEKNFSALSLEVKELENKYNELVESLEKYDKQKTIANTLFKEIYISFLNSLGIKSINRNDLEPFTKVQISGNKYIRSTLAFYLSFLTLKSKLNKDLFKIPLIVDSPFEGDPDDLNREDIVTNICNFYKENNLDYQLIIGVRNARECFADFEDINFIDLNTEEDHLLDALTFEKMNSKIEHYVSIMKNVKLLKAIE